MYSFPYSMFPSHAPFLLRVLIPILNMSFPYSMFSFRYFMFSFLYFMFYILILYILKPSHMLHDFISVFPFLYYMFYPIFSFSYFIIILYFLCSEFSFFHSFPFSLSYFTSYSHTLFSFLNFHVLIPIISYFHSSILQTSTENMMKLPNIILSISWKGIKFIDGSTKV